MIRKAVEDRYDNIQLEIKDLPQWVVYGVDKNKPKCPFTPSTMKPAKAGDPSTWCDYYQAVNCVKEGRALGIGFEFNNNGVYGVDLDHVLEDGNITPEAAEIISLLDSYTKISPSGTGLHIFVEAHGVVLEANRKSFIEIYSKERYFTVTGNVYGQLKPINARTEQLQAVYDKYLKPVPQPMPSPSKTVPLSAPDFELDESYLKRGLEKDQALSDYWNGNRPTGNESGDDQGFMNKLAFWCNKNESLMRDAFLSSPYCAGKDDKHLKKSTMRDDYLNRTIQAAIRDTPTTAREENERYRAEKAFAQPAAAAGNNPEWEQPIPFDNITVPPFPIDCLPYPLKDFVSAVSESTQTPVDMAAVSSLAVMSACVQGKYRIQGKPDWVEPLNLYSVIVANPAERKSAVSGHLTKPIYDYEFLKNEANREEINRSILEKNLIVKEIERLMTDVARGKGDKDLLLKKQDELTNYEEVKPLRLLADDASPEALTSLLAANNGRISVISAEGGIFEMLQGRYTQGVNIDTFLKAHCGDPIRVDRKGRPSEYIKEPCMTVLLSIQPQVLNGLVTNEVFRGRGLTARFLYTIPVSTVGNREFESTPIPTDLASRYRDLCYGLLDIRNEGAEILKLSPEAYALSAAFARELEPRLIDDLEGMADFAGKLHGAVLRIAGILHVVNQLVFAGQVPVPAETMQDAIQIGYYFLEHARAAYQLMGADEQMQKAKYILDRLEKNHIEKFTKRDLLRLCRKFKADELPDLLSILVERGYIKEEARSYDGVGRKPEPIFIFNPMTYKLA